MAYIYMVKCSDDSLYTGITKDIKARMKEHLMGSAKSKYTRSKKAVQLCALWSCENYSDAARLEYAIKRLARKDKLLLAENPQSVNEMFEKLKEITFKAEEIFDINDAGDT